MIPLLIATIVASTVLAVYAITKRSWKWMMLSSAFYTPFAVMMSFTLRFNDASFLLPLFHLGAAYALWKGKRALASMMLFPTCLFSMLAWT